MILVADYFTDEAGLEARIRLNVMRTVAWNARDRFYRQIEDEERHGDYEFKDGYGED